MHPAQRGPMSECDCLMAQGGVVLVQVSLAGWTWKVVSKKSSGRGHAVAFGKYGILP